MSWQYRFPEEEENTAILAESKGREKRSCVGILDSAN